MPSDDKFIPSKPFLSEGILLVSLRLKKFKNKFFWVIFCITWILHDLQLFNNTKHCPFQILIFNTFRYATKLYTLPSRVLTIAPCLLLQTYNFFLELGITSLVTEKSELSCSKSFFKSESLFRIPGSVVSNLLWQSRARLMISSLCNFLSANSESAIMINKTNFSDLLQATSDFYLQKYQHASNFELEKTEFK